MWESLIVSDDAVAILFVGLGFLLGLVWTIGLLAIGFVKALKGTSQKGGAKLDVEETRAFQELERGFRGMEQRVETLETLIIDRSRPERVRPPFE